MEKILIIQDSPAINMLLKARLQAGGFSAEAVETGEDGLEKAKAGDYQLVLLDYTLPGMDGAEVSRILKKGEKTKGVPILIMSAKDENELKKITRDAGADGYIDTSSVGKEFVEKIRSFLN